jgi:hypothetical protein
MKLWKISQGENREYDTYDSAVVAARTEEEARQTSPYPEADPTRLLNFWAAPKDINVEYLGTAAPGTKAGVIVASFNAG